jgi:hypothetical protein
MSVQTVETTDDTCEHPEKASGRARATARIMGNFIIILQ